VGHTVSYGTVYHFCFLWTGYAVVGVQWRNAGHVLVVGLGAASIVVVATGELIAAFIIGFSSIVSILLLLLVLAIWISGIVATYLLLSLRSLLILSGVRQTTVV